MLFKKWNIAERSDPELVWIRIQCIESEEQWGLWGHKVGTAIDISSLPHDWSMWTDTNCTVHSVTYYCTLPARHFMTGRGSASWSLMWFNSAAVGKLCIRGVLFLNKFLAEKIINSGLERLTNLRIAMVGNNADMQDLSSVLKQVRHDTF